ncbi:MAG: Superoxide dismutase [Candidatus Saccharibacteria bacterium]|nr:Superoxide dismutase [Candidatus Saccharibacteria bacterium]
MFTLPDLGYDYDALGKYVSKDIMQLHHDKHHQTYVDKLNAAIDKEPTLKGQSLEGLLTSLESVPESVRTAVRNHGGGHYNHSLFWQWMSPDGGGEPSGKLAADITTKYGSFQAFVDEFEAKALAVFGSGWVWLQPDLTILTTPNQDTPINTGLQASLLGLDVWEHAYYLDYKNKRDDYVKAWWNVVNWEFVQSRAQQ